MKKITEKLQRIENMVMIVTFIVMILSSFAQVVNRNIVGAGISWFEELSRYCMVYMALLGTEIGLRDGSQIAISALVSMYKGLTRKVLDIIARTVVVGYSLVIFCTSFVLLGKQMRFGQYTPGLGIPMYIPYFALALSFGIICLVQGAALIRMFADLFRKTPAAEGGTA